MNKTDWHICVLIPARNEEALLPRCLHSILAACANLPATTTVDVIVAIDASTDRSQQISQEILQDKGLVISVEYANVGSTRKAAAAIALERYAGPLNRCWIANTDADCEVPVSWLSDQLAYANEGVLCVAGIVSVDSFAEHAAHVPERFKQSYVIFPDGTHPHVHGANMGIRADVYQQVGGWHDVRIAEDHDLWNRITSFGIPQKSDSKLCVVTSGRRVGRAPHGFADTLAAHNGEKNECV